MVRRMAASLRVITISEMLPAPGQFWLADADGHAYTNELRMVVRDLTALLKISIHWLDIWADKRAIFNDLRLRFCLCSA